VRILGSNPRATLIRIAVLVVSSVVVFGFILLPVRMEGISMLPTYSGGINFANRLSYRSRRPQRGDAVAIRMAGPGVVYVKRIVGLPGERLEIAIGVVLINGEPLVEPNVAHKQPWNMPEVTLGADEYFVIGDNRGMPMRSHDFGKASRDRIIGKMMF
jgi:signal peptidase I